MDVKTTHPSIDANRTMEWRLMRDAVEGESAIKAAQETYLPMPSGFKSLKQDGQSKYLTYLARAQFPELVSPTIGAMLGIAFEREVDIQMPAAMEYLREIASADGLTLQAFHRRLTRELLTVGRFGVLVDAPVDGGNPYLAGYLAETIINWDAGFYVLDETGMERDGFKWKRVPQFRVLEMIEGAYVQTVYRGEDLQQVEQIVARTAGGSAMDRIPFVVGSTKDLTPEPVVPPLIGVARAARSMYQLSADYRWQLFMSGQETLAIINGDAPSAVGAGVVITLKGAEGITPDAKYVSPSCSGIEAHRLAMEEQRKEAVAAGARLFDQSTNAQESGSARALRFASETANLKAIVLSACALLEKALRNVAVMLGLNENEVVVVPPDDLLNQELSPAEAQAMVSVWQSGAISYETLYEYLQRGGIASEERTSDEELALLDENQIVQTAGNDVAA